MTTQKITDSDFLILAKMGMCHLSDATIGTIDLRRSFTCIKNADALVDIEPIACKSMEPLQTNHLR